jgi:hypothetical protein
VVLGCSVKKGLRGQSTRARGRATLVAHR